jgi:hypothetical protein
MRTQEKKNSIIPSTFKRSIKTLLQTSKRSGPTQQYKIDRADPVNNREKKQEKKLLHEAVGLQMGALLGWGERPAQHRF